jgi:hypothetical protein
MVVRSHLKKVFSSDIGVEPPSQILDILEYACGLILGPALISKENPNFEMTSSVHSQMTLFALLGVLRGFRAAAYRRMPHRKPLCSLDQNKNCSFLNGHAECSFFPYPGKAVKILKIVLYFH